MKSSELLKNAKTLLSTTGCDELDDYVCYAMEAYVDSIIDTPQRAEALQAFIRVKQYIVSVLGTYATVDDWVEGQVVGLWQWIQSNEYHVVRQQMQAYRHRWVDHMIALFEAQGD